MEHLIVIIIFGVIAIFNWAIRQGSKQGGGQVDKGSPPFTPRRIPRPTQVQSTESEEERTRKFLEALGVPSGAQPPPRIVRPVQQTVPPAVPRSQQLPRAGQVIPKQVVRKAIVPPPPVPAISQPVLSTADYEAVSPESMNVAALAAAFSSAAVPSSGAAPAVEVLSTNLTDLQSLLKSPSSIRAAMILKEVLGPPKSLQGAGGISGLL